MVNHHIPHTYGQRKPIKKPSRKFLTVALLIIVAYIVVLYVFFVSPFSFRWKALFGEIIYPKDYDLHGIDISHHQGDIDWDLLRAQGDINGSPVCFVMIKATEGSDRIDSRFETNFFQAKEHAFICGVYHFWSNSTAPEKQAQFYIDNVQLQQGDLPPVLDVETKSKSQSLETFRNNILTWLDIIEKHYGVPPIIYTGVNFKEKYLSGEAFNNYPYWIAHYYVEELKYTGEWKFWQYTDVGRLPGIDGFVDFDTYNGSYYDLKKLTIK